jgi:hypothetical protein
MSKFKLSKVLSVLICMYLILRIFYTISHDVALYEGLKSVLCSKWLCIIIVVIISNIIVSRTTPRVFKSVSECIRQDILRPYRLSDRQVKFRIASGDSVYAESAQEKVFIMISGMKMSSKVKVKNLFSGKEAVCEYSAIIDSMKCFIDRGYKFYDSVSYKELLDNGYVLQYEG